MEEGYDVWRRCGDPMPFDIGSDITCTLEADHLGDHHWQDDSREEWCWPQGLRKKGVEPPEPTEDNPWPGLFLALEEATEQVLAGELKWDQRIGYKMVRGMLRYLRWATSR